MKLILLIALGIIAVPFVALLLIVGLVTGVAHLKLVLGFALLFVAGIVVQRKVFERNGPVTWTDKGELVGSARHKRGRNPQ